MGLQEETFLYSTFEWLNNFRRVSSVDSDPLFLPLPRLFRAECSSFLIKIIVFDKKGRKKTAPKLRRQIFCVFISKCPCVNIIQNAYSTEILVTALLI